MLVWDSMRSDIADVNTFTTLPFTSLKVMDETGIEAGVGQTGTIIIHTDALLLDYYKNEKETKKRIHIADGVKWFDTGDLGRLTQKNAVRFMGRKRRIIKRGANLIYPEEVESFLLTHPDIEAAAVTSEPHELMGEAVTAYIQPRSGCRFTRRDMVRFCTGRISAYKIPDKTVVVKTVPKDIGKVQFKYIRE